MLINPPVEEHTWIMLMKSPVNQVCHIAQTHHLNDDDDDTCTANYGPYFNENSYKEPNLQDS